MASSKEHYASALSAVYSWMYGGFEAALARNTQWLAQHGIGAPRGSSLAVDLGAGCGFQSIPLARLGYEVTAIDQDRALLEELATQAGSLPIVRIEDDLTDFRSHLDRDAELIVCMTDTVLHLGSQSDVRQLLADGFAALEPGGRFVLTFRDLTRELEGLDRFIPVRSDADTIFTCFLEYEPETVKVHDLIYAKHDDGWRLTKSYYRKLRVSGEWVLAELDAVGFAATDLTNDRGALTIVATRGP